MLTKLLISCEPFGNNLAQKKGRKNIQNVFFTYPESLKSVTY